MLNLLNNIKKINNELIQNTYKYFRGISNRITMDQGEGHLYQEQREEQLAQGNLQIQNNIMQQPRPQYEPLQNLALEEIGANVDDGMDITDDSESESDNADENNDEEVRNYDELEDIMDQNSWSSEEYDLENLISEMGLECALRRFAHMHKMFIKRQQEQKKTIYCFQPLRLIQCLYKSQSGSLVYPIARSGHRVIASESHLYSLGGYNPNRTTNAIRRDACALFQELWAYNFATNRWKLLQDANNSEMPKELASNALVIYNNVLISHAGTGFPFGETCSNDCYIYTTGENPQVMLLKVTGDLPAAQYGPGIVIHKDYLYTIGGTTGHDYSCDVYRLNLVTKVWENVYICRPDMRDDPEGRYRHEVVYDGRYIYVLGGGTSLIVYDLQRIPAFNLETNRWEHFETLPDRTATTLDDPGFPRARKCLSCVQHTLSNGDIEAFITGGLQGDSTYFNDIWKLNLRSKQWYKIHTASLPRPLYFHSAAHAGNGCMYIFGGVEYSEKYKRRRNDLFKMWMTIPKLSDICWDAITYYNTNLHHFDRDTLLGAGIPDRFVNRLPPLHQQMQKRMTDESDQPSPSSIISALSKRMRSHIE